MSDSDEGRDGKSPGPGDREAVGSVGDEAAKLLGALSEWARDQGTDYAGSAAAAAGTFADALQDVSGHIATEGEDCRYCPVCQVIHVVRQTSPEVRQHLSQAASSLMHAAAGLLDTHADGQQKSASVEKIDLDTGADWDEDQ
ncbi:MAG: hypothetical protein JWR85_221 [Marmoricola sp.]|nr:hypothetical protein [Marmoricola sp.]